MSHSLFGCVGLHGPGGRLLSQLVEVPIGNDEHTQEDQRIDDVEGVQGGLPASPTAKCAMLAETSVMAKPK